MKINVLKFEHEDEVGGGGMGFHLYLVISNTEPTLFLTSLQRTDEQSFMKFGSNLYMKL